MVPTQDTGFQVININDDFTAGHLNSPHKIPNNLWTLFEKNRDVVEEKEDVYSTEVSGPRTDTPEETNTEGFNVASIMSYAMPDSTPTHPQLVIIEDLDKPSDHESEVLVLETEELEEGEQQEQQYRKGPKSFDLNVPDVQNLEQGEVKVHSFGVEQVVPFR